MVASVLALDLDAFLGLDRLVQAVAPAASRHEAAGELVNDDDAAVLDHVLHVEPVVDVRAQRLLHVVEQRHVGRIVQPAGLHAMRHQLLGLGHAGFGQRRRLVLFVDDVVARRFEAVAILALGLALVHFAARQLRDDAVDFVIEVGRLFRGARDDQRRARFVDQDAVDFIDDREVMATLHHRTEIELHVVAQVVEAELVVRAVSDVAAVSDLALLIVQVVLNHADGHAEEAIQPAHPLRVAAGEVVVHGDDMDALAFEGVEIRRQGRDQGLAFTGLHFRDRALVQHHAADQLHVIVPHAENAAAGLAHDGKGLG